MTKILGLALMTATIATIATPASAAVDQFLTFPDIHVNHGFSAPEIDPASALSAMTMLASGLVIVRGRRSKK
jgi:hypothetical protein